MDDIDGALLDHLAEAVPQVEFLAGRGGHVDGVVDLFVAVDVPPGHDILQPGQVVRLDRVGQPDHLFGRHIAVAEVIGAE